MKGSFLISRSLSALAFSFDVSFSGLSSSTALLSRSLKGSPISRGIPACFATSLVLVLALDLLFHVSFVCSILFTLFARLVVKLPAELLITAQEVFRGDERFPFLANAFEHFFFLFYSFDPENACFNDCSSLKRSFFLIFHLLEHCTARIYWPPSFPFLHFFFYLELYSV